MYVSFSLIFTFSTLQGVTFEKQNLFQTKHPVFTLVFEVESALRGLVCGRRTLEAATTKLHHRYILKRTSLRFPHIFPYLLFQFTGIWRTCLMLCFTWKALLMRRQARKRKKRKNFTCLWWYIIVILMKVHFLRHNNPRTLNCSYFCYNPFHTHE